MNRDQIIASRRQNAADITTWLYDTAGRIRLRQDSIDGKLLKAEYEYDGNDNLRAIVYPFGRRIEYDYNREGQPTRVFESAAGRDHAAGITYHPSGAVATYAAGNGIATTITYDPARYWARSVSSGALQLTYDNYDYVGNVRTIGDPRPTYTQTFVYDALDRLQNATGPQGSTGYTYNLHGNRTGPGYQYQPGTLRLTNQNGIAFTYYNNGNLWTAGSATYTYTHQNMLASVSDVGGTATYAYDADDQRVKKDVGGSKTYYSRGLNGEVLTEWKNPGTIRDYVYAGTRLLSAIDKSGVGDPNDTCGVIVPGGAAVNVTALAGQNPCLTFTATAGQLISAVITSVLPTTTFSGTWNFNLFKPDGFMLGSTWACCGDTSAFVDTLALPQSGTYRVVVDPSGTTSGTVSLRMYNIVHATGTIVANGQPVAVSLTVPGQNAILTFAGTAGQSVSMSMTAVSPTSFPTSWFVKLFKPDGNQLSYGSACCLFTEAFADTVPLPVSGTYTIVVDPTNMLMGTVNVRLHTVTHLTGTITMDGTPVSGSLNTPGQNAWLTFAGTQGQRVSLLGTNGTIAYQQIGCGVTVKLLKPDGFELSGSATCMESTPVLMEPVTLPATGAYTVLVDPAASAVGGLTLQLYNVPADVTGEVTIGGAGVPVTLTAPGQNGALTFNGTQGQQVTVQMTGNTIGLTTVKLLKPDNNVLTQTSSLSSSFNLTTQTLPTTGTYRIVVDPSGSNTGSVTVAVSSP